MKKHLGKRFLSTFLALVMVLAMLPASVFAAEADYAVGDTTTTKTDAAPTDVDPGVWVLNESSTLSPNPSTDCGYSYEHTHSDNCYEKSCGHHDANCYGATYSKCNCDATGNTHTGSVNLSDVLTYEVTWSGWRPSLDIQWVTSHDAYDVVYAEYISLGGNGSTTDKISAVTSLMSVEFCYTTDSEPSCGHPCSEVGGACYEYSISCSLNTGGTNEEHTHEYGEDGCYVYTWTLEADANDNEIVDGTDDDPYYTVTYTDGVGGVCFADQTTQVLKGSDGNLLSVPAFSGTPTRTGYTFTGWSPEVPATLSGSQTFTAQWDAIEYQITWLDGDGNTLKTEQVSYDQTPVYTGETPTKTADAQYTYAWDGGWSPAVTAVTGPETYTATFSNPTTNTYTVTWKNGDTVLETDEDVAYGTTPNYDGATPTKDATAQYTYTFDGWSPAISTVSGEVTYYAQFEETVNTYTVTWKNGDTVLETDENVPYGTMPEYNGATPTQDETAEFTYTHNGWSPAVSSVTGDVNYVATFSASKKSYAITWNAGEGEFSNGQKTMTTSVPYGEVPVAPETPVKAADGQTNWNFGGWGNVVPVTDETTYIATYTAGSAVMYTVTWYDEDGTTELFSKDWAYGSIPVFEGTTPTKSGNTQYTYTFVGWEPMNNVGADGKITGAATYKASYTSTVNEYEIIFEDENGNALQSGKVPYGTVPTFGGTEPTKAATAQYTYTFAGWTPAVVAVAGDATYTVVFTETVNKYDVTWVIDSTTETVEVEYGTVPTHSTPEKDYYTFAGWNPGVQEVSGDVTYTATWTINNDVNNNNIPDEKETLTVVLNQTGDGNVTLTPAGNATLVSKVDNVYTYLYDSTDAANKVINVTTSLIDTDGTDGSADYLISAPATVNLGETLTVKFGDRTIVKNEVPEGGYAIAINKGVNPSEQRQDIYDKILAAVVKNAPTGTATVKYDVAHIIGNNTWEDVLSYYLIDTSFNDASEKIKIIYAADGNLPEVSVEVAVAVKDDRTAYADITLGYVSGSYNTEDNFKDALEATVKVNDVAYTLDLGVLGSGILGQDSIVYTEEADGTYTVVITVHGTDAYLETEKTFTGITWTVKQYTIIFQNEDGTELQNSEWDYDFTPTYNGATPTKADKLDDYGNVMATYTHNGWTPAIAAVTGEATYIATFTEVPKTYTVKYVNSDGTTVLQEVEVAYGADVPAYSESEVPTKTSNDPSIVWVHDGWELKDNAGVKDNKVVNDAVYVPTFTTENVYTINYVTGKDDGGNWIVFDTQYVNLTQNPTATIVASPEGNPDAENTFAGKVFSGWDKVGNSPANYVAEGAAKVVYVEVVWTEEVNDNNVLDADETATVVVTVTGPGTVALNNNGNEKIVITETATEGTYNVVYNSVDPADGNKVYVIETPADTKADDGSVDYVVNPVEYVTVADGDTTNVDITFKEHSIPAVSEPSMEVNGKDADSKLAIVTKKAVLETILGETLTDAQVAQYEVKVMVNAAGYNGYYDIWALIDALNGKTDVISETALAALKSAFDTAIDVPGSENFEITWKAHDKFPEVKNVYNVKLTESREPTTVTHTYPDGQTAYTATALDDALLAKIQANLTSNTTISSLAYVNPEQVLTPGTTLDVQVTVNVLETDALYGASHTITVKVEVPTSDIDIKIPTSATIYFNTGMSSTDKVAMLKEEVPYTSYVSGTDILATDVEEKSFLVQYLASTERTVPYTINIAQLDLGLAGSFLPDTIEVQIPVDAMWLDMATMGNDFPVYEAPSNELIRDILLNDLIPNYAADYMAGNITTDQLKVIAADLLAEHPDVANYYKYMGAHQFGEMEQETIRYVVDTQFGSKTTNECVLSMVDTRTETEIKLNADVKVTYGKYTEDELMALILDGVYANDTKVDGLSVEFVTEVIGLPASEASEITVKFAGNEDYKPSTASVNIIIEKAPVTVSVDNRLIKWYEGISYELPVITDPAGVETINFIAGLNVEGVNIDGGLKGFVAQVQLLLPEELQELLSSADTLLQGAGLNVSFANGASMKLSELQAAVEALDDVFAGTDYEEYFRVLLNMLQSLPTDVADIEIILGGEMPTDIGVYVVGAVSADANYTTDFGVGAVVIYPDGTKVDLAWNMNDDNYIITNSLLASYTFDAGASAYERDTNYAVKNDEATEQVAEIFLGVDIDGNITIEMDQTKLDVGAYVEVAMIAEWGNEMYYSEPLVRPIVVVAETLDVDFVDATGAVNNDRHFEFFNVPQDGMEGNLLVTYKQDGEGYKAGDKFTGTYSVKYVYVGVQTDGQPYADTTAPVHAGVYTITAIVVARDGDRVTHAGQGIGALVIEPSKSTTTVENEAIKWDDQEHKVNQFVDADSVNVPGLTPDTTVISAGIHADLDANIGLDAIKGSVNIDMPSWMDNLLNKLNILEAGYADGITAEVFLTYVAKLEAAMAELGVETDAFAEIVDVIEQLPGKTTLTFHSDKGYTEVGVYLIVGIVTDSDHYPSADAGVMVIYPDATKVDLKFNKTWDDNNIFTQEYLKAYDLNAKAYDLGTDSYNAEATAKIINLFVGFADHGEIVLTSDKTVLDNGIYEQVSFILDLSNQPYYAEPINREIVIVPNNADVDFVDEDGNVNNDRHFQFTNEPHAMNAIRVTLVDGTVLNLTAEDSRVAIFYMGVQTNGMPYADYAAPVHAGVYEVTAQYTERDDQNRVINLGVGIGALVIEPSKSETTVDNAAYPYGGEYHVGELVHASSVNVPGLIPDTTVISAGLSADLDNVTGLEAINGTVNIDLPAWFDKVMNELNILEAGYANGISTDTFLGYAEKIREALVELDVDTASFDEIVSFVEQLPITTNLTFEDNIGYTEVGAYLVIAVVTDSDHYPSVGAGVMVIHPDVTKVELKFEEDWNGNNIFTWHALKNMNLEAEAYLNGTYCEEADKKVVNLYFGFTDDGEFLLEAVTYGETIESVPEFRNGLYTQLALVQDFGNVMYYAEPISRAFMIVPTPAIIEFVDDAGNVNADRHFIFNNQPQGMDVRVTIAGVEQTDLSGLTVTYVGVQTNGVAYNSTEAPEHAGAYVVTATYTARDELDRLVTLGAAIGAMVIEPAETTTDVVNKTHEYDGNAVSTKDMVVVTTDSGVKPDTTIFTAAIKTDGTFSENLLGAIKGEMNVDLPKWVDEIIAEYAILADGLSAADFITIIEKVKAEVVKLAAEVEVEVELDVFDQLIAVAEQLPADTNLTFNDAPSYKEVGAYLVIGVVTDSDHYPSMDAGVLVIYPDVDEAELHWIYEDANKNNIFTLDTLNKFDLGAYATVGGVESDDVPFQVLYLGVNAETMEITFTRDQADLDVGVYTEIAYVLEVDSQMYVAAPIVRELVIVHNAYDVEAEDVTETYDGTAKEIGTITVKDQFGNDVIGKGELTVTYIGLTAGIDGYLSSNAPTEAGRYNVVITFTTYDDEGNFTGAGTKIASLTIEKATPKYELNDRDVCEGDDHLGEMIKNDTNLPYAIYVIRNTALGEVNVILPAGWEITLPVGAGVDALVTALEELPAAIEHTDVVEALKAQLNEIEMTTLTINGAEPADAGVYDVFALAFGNSNYGVATAHSTLSIAQNHNYEAVVTAPTCTEDGYTTYTCSFCGDSYVADEVAALEHSFTKYESDGNATCTADGTKTAKCDCCDATDTVTDEGSELGHSFTKYESDGNATCTADGTKTAKCDRCDATDTVTDEDSALGHSFTKYESDGNATCEEDGTKTAKCDRCDATDTVTDDGSKLGHDWGDPVAYVDNGDGTHTAKYVCGNDASHTKTDDPVAHTFENGKCVCDAQAVARIGTTYFLTLAEAATAAKDHDTIVLLTGINLTSSVMFGRDAAVKVTIDLADYTLTAKDAAVISWRTGTELTFINGTISGNSSNGTLRATYNGKIVLGDGIKVTSGGSADAIVVDTGVLEVVEGATVEVIGGINCIETAGTTTNAVTITGGNFVGAVVINENSTCVITGGTFTQDVNEYCAEGYYAHDNGDGTWTVKTQTKLQMATVNTVLYYNGTAQAPVASNLVVTDENGNVVDASDYTVVAAVAVNVGMYKLTVLPIERSYMGSVEADWGIAPAQVTITVADKTMGATDEEIPELTHTVTVVTGAVTDTELGVKLSAEPAKNDVGQYIPGEYGITATYVASNNWDVTVENGSLTVKLGNFICWNMQTGVYYDDVTNALTEAKSGETVQMLADYEETDYVIVTAGRTLDLNGYDLTAAYLVAFNGAYVMDCTSSDKNVPVADMGHLIVPKNCVVLNEDNGNYFPVWTGSSYQFGTTLIRLTTDNTLLGKDANGNVLYAFRYDFTGAKNELERLLVEDETAVVKVRLSWTASNGTQSEQDFTLPDELAANMYSNAYYVATLTVTGLEEVSEITIFAIIESITTDVECHSEVFTVTTSE